MQKHIAVIGGGMAGTAAADSLTKLGHRVTIIEKNTYIGGRMRTHMVKGAAIEMGACFMTNFYTNLHGFLTEYGLDDQLYAAKSTPALQRKGRIMPGTAVALAGNQVVSWRAKLGLLRLACVQPNRHRL